MLTHPHRKLHRLHAMILSALYPRGRKFWRARVTQLGGIHAPLATQCISNPLPGRFYNSSVAKPRTNSVLPGSRIHRAVARCMSSAQPCTFIPAQIKRSVRYGVGFPIWRSICGLPLRGLAIEPVGQSA